MVLMVTTSWFPSGKSEEVGKKFLEVTKKYPDDPSIAKPILRVGVRPTQDGMKVIAISEVQKGKYEEAMSLSIQMLLEYSDIEGFRYEIETFMSGKEALPLVGLAMPK